MIQTGPNTVCQEITTEVIGQIGVDHRIKWAQLRLIDGLIIASGTINNADIIISNDTHFRKAVAKDYILAFDV